MSTLVVEKAEAKSAGVFFLWDSENRIGLRFMVDGLPRSDTPGFHLLLGLQKPCRMIDDLQ